MTIRLLGTGAAEGIPAFYCGCRICESARKQGGSEVRKRSGALVDGHLKIDFPPDTLAQHHRDGLDARDWSALFFTHSHDDHFCLEELQYGLYPFNDLEVMGFSILGNAAVCTRICERYPGWPMEVQETRAFEAVAWGEYRVTPIKARHMEGEEEAHNLIVSDGGKSLLYATDTGVWLDESWDFLQSVRLDCLVMECTSGTSNDDYAGHHTLATFLEVVSRLRDSGILKPESTVCSTHHSHNGDMTYAELVEAFRPYRVIAGCDGLEIEI